MAKLTDEFKQAWDNIEAAAVFTTVDTDGVPNSIWVKAMKIVADDKIAIADNYFDKTRANIKSGSRASFLIIDDKRNNFQVKGSIDYHTDGEVYDEMKKWNREDLPGVAVAVLNVEEMWTGAKKIS